MDRKLKHLDFIQGVINRLSTNSFLLKGWSVILVSALFALSANDSRVAFVYLAYVPAVAFWGLDAYFLALEREYRAHYDRVRTQTPDAIDFSMSIGDLSGGTEAWFKALLSKTILVFHGAVLASIIVVMLVQRSL